MDLPITQIGKLARFGLDAQMINGKTQNGPFKIVKKAPTAEPYPALWNHHAKKDNFWERKLTLTPDSYGVVRKGHKVRAMAIWSKTASRLHANRDFSLRSQCFSMVMTESEVMGGRAWPSIMLFKEEFEKPIVLWANSTLGLMSFWWIANRQQEGRSIVTLRKLPSLCVLDATRLSPEQLTECQKLFDEISSKTFLPATQSNTDSTRLLLDEKLFNILKLPAEILASLEVVRSQWCDEPTV